MNWTRDIELPVRPLFKKIFKFIFRLSYNINTWLKKVLNNNQKARRYA